MSGDSATLFRLAERVRDYQKKGVKLNEANTKATLVEPLLEWLGWDIHDPNEVSREWRRKGNEEPVDYALLGGSGTRLLLVEAKPITDNLKADKGWRQLAANGVNAGFNWCVRTNGQIIILINLLHHAELEEKVFWVIDLSQVGIDGGLSADDAGGYLKLISKSSLAERETDREWDAHQGRIRAQTAVARLIGDPPRALVDIVCECAGEPRLHEDVVVNCLRRLQSVSDVAEALPNRPPLAMKVQNRGATAAPRPAPAAAGRSAAPKSGKSGIVHIADEAFPIEHGKDIVVKVAEWLIAQGRLRMNDCPIRVSRESVSERYLISAEPLHPNGREFFIPVQLSNGAYIETHVSSTSGERQSRQLLRWASYDGGMLRVEWL